jgi:cold shock CspA family protein/ribosome-associated translation inhibitor RaiA
MQVIFHDVQRTQWVDDYIAERARRLDRFAAGITSCRVTLAQEQASQHKGNRYSVLIELHVPPHKELTVRKQKNIVDLSQQLPALINLAFGAVERQLKKTAELRRHEQKQHDGQPHGMIERLYDEGYGFIRAVDDDRQFYFHRNSVLHGDFERLAIGTEVRFSPEEGDEGPQASSVQLLARPSAG